MFALAINGSPRKEGNTNLMLQKVLEPLIADGWETELIHIGGKPLRGCLACQKCFDLANGKCAIQTDAFNDVFGKMLQANAVIIGSPTYYAGMNAETKAFIDRAGFVAMANGNLLKGKVGAAVAAVRRGGAVHVVEGIMRMYLISHMIIPGSAYWNMAFGLEQGEAANDEEGMGNMDNLGKSIALLGKAVAPLAKDWPA